MIDQIVLRLVSALVLGVLMLAMLLVLIAADNIRDGLSWWIVGAAIVLLIVDEVRFRLKRRRRDETSG